jgi:glycolate oxidase FAD binding subunit
MDGKPGLSSDAGQHSDERLVGRRRGTGEIGRSLEPRGDAGEFVLQFESSIWIAVTDNDNTKEIQENIRAAAATGTALFVHGGNTKAFYGRAIAGKSLDVRAHRGIVSYEPTELVVSARAGTPLTELEAALDERGQILPFEPPHFGEAATLGGAVSCGLSGPARPYAGSVRDFVLGVVCVNGQGERLSFGGQVMKNVAGYDVSRLMAGAMGTLGVLLEISLKVLPRPGHELTLALEMDASTAIATMNGWAAQPLPISATCYEGQRLRVRLSGSDSGVRFARKKIGGEEIPHGNAFWSKLREQQLPFFKHEPLWRLSVPAATPAPNNDEPWLLDWGGAQRWLMSERDARTIREDAAAAGGHAVLFRGGDRSGEVFHPLAPALETIHRRLKEAFDPKGILNPGRLYRAW